MLSCGGGGINPLSSSRIVQSEIRSARLTSELLLPSPIESVSDPAELPSDPAELLSDPAEQSDPTAPLSDAAKELPLSGNLGQGNGLFALTNLWTVFIVDLISSSLRPKLAQYDSGI